MDHQIHGTYNNRPTEYSETVVDANFPLSEEQFRRVHKYEAEPEPGIKEMLKKQMQCSVEKVRRLLPIAEWLPRYRGEAAVRDLIAGLTVAVIHIPQGMAYALLAGVPPVVGIYTAIFPVFVYIIMGTSPHVSMGTFAVICMMVSKSVHLYSSRDDALPDATDAYAPVEVATAVCLAVGIWQTALGILKLGSLSVYLSATLVSGFTTGAAIHVFTSQVKSLLGIRVQRFSGPLKLVYTYADIVSNVKDTNYVAVAMSACVIVFLGLYNESVKPFLNRKFKRNVPVPIELFIVVVGTVCSTQFQLNERHGVSVVNEVPVGLPSPTLPVLGLLPKVLSDSFVIGVVAVVINLSMADVFAKKLGYRIDGNQEVLASGLGNVFGSFFSCLPYAASLSRSLIQVAAGGKTQITNLVSCLVLISVLLFVAPFFEPLPFCVLASIIVVALKGMFLQFKDLVRIAKLSKIDGFVWLATFLGVVVLDVDFGLIIGLAVSICTVLYRSHGIGTTVLGRIPGTQIFKDRRSYKKAQSVEGIVIVQLTGGIYFANVDVLRDRLLGEVMHTAATSVVLVHDTEKPVHPPNLVVDMSAVSYMDLSAITAFANICSELAKFNCICVLCQCRPSVYDSLRDCKFFETFPVDLVFPSISHAVDYLEKLDAQSYSNSPIFQIA